VQPGALGIFTAIATWIFAAYWFVANNSSSQKLYNYWAMFAVEFFVWVFWLTTFALYASYVVDSLAMYGGSSSSSSSTDNQLCYAGYCVNYKRSLTKRYRSAETVSAETVSACLYTALAFSVINL